MSVRQLPDNKLRLECDGCPHGPCNNHYALENSTAGMQAAEDFLTRHGWRTIEGRLHYCRFCSQRMDVFQSEVTASEYKHRTDYRYRRA